MSETSTLKPAAMAARTGIWAWLIALAVFADFPVIWMVLSSIKPYGELYTFPPTLVPRAVSLDFYRTVLDSTPFIRFVVNSLIVVVGTTVVSLVVSAMAGYSLARFRFPGQQLLSQSVLLAYIFPQILLVIPLFTVIANLGLANTYLGLILAYVTFTFPFATWLLMAYFQAIPMEIEEAARVDGASNFGIFRLIAIPLSAPGLVTAAIFTAINAWNEFLYALVILGAGEQRTLPVGLFNFVGGEQAQYGPLMAATTLTIAPILIFFLLIQGRLTPGLTAGAVKG